MNNKVTSITKQPTRQNEPPKEVEIIGKMVEAVAPTLPPGVTQERLHRLILSEWRRPGSNLRNATQSSIFEAIAKAVALGFEPFVGDDCYILPYKNKWTKQYEAQLIIGYQGYVSLFWRNPLAKRLDSGVIFEGDDVEVVYGTHPRLYHRPMFKNVNERKPVAFYAVAELTNGGMTHLVMTPHEVDQLRRKSGEKKGSIADPQYWMERKTVVKQLLKLLPKSVQQQHAPNPVEPAETQVIEVVENEPA